MIILNSQLMKILCIYVYIYVVKFFFMQLFSSRRSRDGMTPTHAVCFEGNLNLLEQVIEAGGDLRLHDNEGAGMKDWAQRNTDVKRRNKIIDYLEETHTHAMSYSEGAVGQDHVTKLTKRSESIMKLNISIFSYIF